MPGASAGCEHECSPRAFHRARPVPRPMQDIHPSPLVVEFEQIGDVDEELDQPRRKTPQAGALRYGLLLLDLGKHKADNGYDFGVLI